MKFFLKLLLVLMVFSLMQTGEIYAQESTQLDLPKTSINPGSFYYPFKRLIEKSRERVTFSREGKISFYRSLFKIRLSELNYVVSKNFLSEVQGSSERFAYTAGILTEEVIKQKKADEKTKLTGDFSLYSKFLDTLRDKYPANSSFWMLIQHDINSLNILSEQMK